MGLTRIRADQISDIDYKQAVRVVSLSNVTLTGSAPATVDGVSLAVNDRILVAGQNTGSQNGLYYVQTVGTGSTGTWVRSSDGNASGEIESGMIVMVTEGTDYADTQWKLTTDNPITLGVTALTFVQNYSANSISAGTSNVVVNSNANVTVSSAGTANVLVVTGTGANIAGTLSASGNITGSYFLGNGSQLSGIITTVSANTLTGNTLSSNVVNSSLTSVGTLGSLSVTGNVSSGNLNITGNLVDTGALSIITGSSGNISLAPNGTNVLVATTTGANIAGTLNATGNANVGNLGATNIVGTLTTAAQTNITSVGTLGSLSVTGNITGGNLLTSGNIVDTNALSIITGASGNISLAPNGTNVLIATTTGANVTGTLNATGNANVGNLGTAGQITATGTITSTGATNSTGFAVGNSAVSNVGLGFFPTAGTRGDFAIRDYSTVTSTMYMDVGMGGSAAGEFQFRTSNAFTLLMRANSTGVYTPGVVSANGNVSGLELTSTQSSGDEGGQLNLAKAATNTTLAGNIIVDVYQNRFRIFENGGTNRGAYIDLTAANASVGTNLLSGGGGTPGGANTNVQFNDAGTFGGNGQFVYNKVTNIVTAGAFAGNTNGTGQNFQVGDDAWIGDINISDTIGLKGQQNPANAYLVFGNSDATGKLGRAGTGPLTYAGAFSATGNITGGNILGGANVNATTHTGTTVSVTGNITGGNLLINTNAVITGNLSVLGTETIFNVANLTVNDKDIIVANNVTGGANVNGAGIQAGNPATATWFFNNATTSWQSNIAITPTANGTLALGGTSNYWGAAYVTTLTASGNANVGNLGAATVVATTLTGTLSTAAQTNITSVGTLGSLSVTGNVTGGNLLTSGNIVDTGAMTIITGASGNISLAPNGTNVLVATTTGANIAGTLNATGNANVGNLGADTVVATTLTGTLSTATQTNITSVGTLGSLSVTGNITSGNLSGTSIVGTLTTAAQTNITSVGTLGSLSVTGNITSGNINATLNGSGANVTSISATNISSGTLAQARLANASLTVNGTSIALGGSGTVTATATNALTIGTGLGGTSYNGSTGVTITNTGVTSAVAGTGIGVSGATGAVTITNSGVTSVVAGTNIAVSGATGAVTVSVSGTVASATTASQIDSIEFRNGDASNGTSPDNVNNNGTGYVTSVSLFGQTDGALYSQAYSTSWVHQIFGDYRTGQLAVRGRNSGTLTAWRTILDSTNYTSYAPTLTGTGASGTWSINVTGSAGSATTATSATTAGTVTTAAQGNITSVGTLTSLTVSGALSSGAHTITGSPVTALINGGTNGVGNIGASGATFNTVFAKATSAQYADVAENYLADAEYPIGTVLEFGGNTEITISKESHSSAVAGTVSDKPAYIMNSGLTGEHVTTVALLGRVPCRVVGQIRKGNLLVSSHIPGVATALDKPQWQPGCVIGKALEEYNSDKPGVIEVVIGRF